MTLQRRRCLAAVPALGLSLASTAAGAGWLELFNGVRVGQSVDVSLLRYLAQPQSPSGA